MFGKSRRNALLLVFSIMLAQLIVPTVAHAATCGGKRATKTGTKKSETIKGTAKADVIVAGGGKDVVKGLGGNDTICAGPGNDKVDGGGGNDTVSGQEGTDHLFGGAGNDSLSVDTGTFEDVTGGPGDDTLNGNESFVLAGYAKAPAAVTVSLQDGTATGGDGNDTLSGIAGVEGSSFDDSLTGNDGVNFLLGGSGNDSIDGGGNSGVVAALHDTQGDVTKGAIFDVLGGGPGDDNLLGRTGVDIITFDTATQGITATLNDGHTEGEGNDQVTGIDVVLGTQFDDVIFGDDRDNAFEGFGGKDTIDGRKGDDAVAFFDSKGANANLTEGKSTATYGTDSSTDSITQVEDLWGSSFADTLVGGTLPNEIWGEGGDDQMTGDRGNDQLRGGDGNDTADGGDGTDVCEAESETTCERDPVAPEPRPDARPWFRFL